MTTTSFSPPTSTSSYTLSAANSLNMDARSPLADVLLTTLTENPHSFLQPQQNLHASALALAKQFLDPLASGVTEAQDQRQTELRKKRKRGNGGAKEELLRMKKVHVEGFRCEQVWEQARRVIDATQEEIIRALPDVEEDSEESDGADTPRQNGVKTVRFADDRFEIGEDGESLDEGEEGLEDDEDGSEVEDEDDSVDELQDGDDYDEDMEDLTDGQSEDDFDDTPAETFVSDKFGLNDGFFSIDNFNKQSQLLEQQNLQEVDDDEDEEIDYFADPLAGGSMSLTNGTGDKGEEDGEDDDDGEEGGPTFGNMDLDAPEGASDLGDDDEDMEAGDLNGLSNANNILYADFFAPPAKKGGKNKKKRGRPNPHNFPAKDAAGPANSTTTADADQADIERAMADVHRDLFSDEDASASEEDTTEKPDPGDPKSRRSTHERRQARIAEEIRKLEAANVAKRAWTLSGEARAADRPLNSLLEEDLDFERAGKPVPVITAEVSEDIEALIKRRILASDFDELVRRRPDDLATGPRKRGLVDLPDTKSAKGLGEIYEEEHIARTDPSYVSAADAKTATAHAEISALWNGVSRQLDALCSYHYRPKPAVPSLEIRVDAPALSMEDARPTAGTEMGSASQLAPQEVYKPGAEKVSGEVVTRGGMPVAREEMEREDKARRRRRAKERAKKSAANKAVVTVGRDGKEVVKTPGKREQDKEVVGALKKGGVKVIGKKGELTNVDGSQIKGGDVRRSAGAFRL